MHYPPEKLDEIRVPSRRGESRGIISYIMHECEGKEQNRRRKSGQLAPCIIKAESRQPAPYPSNVLLTIFEY